MAKSKSDGTGTATIPAATMDQLIRDATGLPTTFFVTTTKAKVLTDGSLEAKYSFSTEGAPPPPALTKPAEGTDGNI